MRQTYPLPLLWDNHVGFAPKADTASVEFMFRHRAAGFNVIIMNLGDSGYSLEHIVRMAAYFRAWLAQHADEFQLISNVNELDEAVAAGKTAVCFNLEGVHAIADQLEVIPLLYDLGVRWIAMVYNRKNLAGFGVHDDVDEGLTAYGRQITTEMDRVGVIKCLSHTGYKTAMDVLSNSDKPCIFSHSNVLALKNHARNIPDELIKACAATNGVVGINGINIFLAKKNATAQHMVEHIDYIAQLVGVEHVGIGIDQFYMDDTPMTDFISDPKYWPAGNEYNADVECLPPESIADVYAGLQNKGYNQDDIGRVFGLNMRRVAEAVWK